MLRNGVRTSSSPGPPQPVPPRPPARLARRVRGRTTTPKTSPTTTKLDHLATRMRRNAESLLVLARVESPPPLGPARADSTTSCAPPSARSRTTAGSHVSTRRRAGAGSVVADVAHLSRRAARQRHPVLPAGHPVRVGGRLSPRRLHGAHRRRGRRHVHRAAATSSTTARRAAAHRAVGLSAPSASPWSAGWPTAMASPWCWPPGTPALRPRHPSAVAVRPDRRPTGRRPHRCGGC